MKKKLSFLMVALVAVAAFAVQVSRRAVAELTVVSEATVWDFADVTLGESYTGDFQLKGDDKNTENIYANFNDITFASTFKADALAFAGEYPVRSNSKKFAQSGTLHFKTSVAGKIVVKFSDTGSSASATAVKRYLVVNGIQTEYWTSRENNGTDSPYAAQLNVETGEIDVPAGDVTIKGSSAIVVTYVAFTPNAAEGGETGVVETSYTIAFKDAGAGKPDGSEAKTTIADLIADGADKVDAITANKAYLGKEGYGAKFGTSSVNGNITLTLKEAVKATKITVNAAAWVNTQGNADAATISVNAAEAKTLTTDFADYTFELDGTTDVTAIAITFVKRAYVKSVTVFYNTEAAPVSPYPAEAIWGNELKDWPEAETIAADKLTGLQAGDELVVTVIKNFNEDATNEWNAQIDIQSNGYKLLACGFGVEEASAEAPIVAEVVISGLMKSQILEHGLTVKGNDIQAYITINKAQTPAADNTVWIGEKAITQAWGAIEMPSGPYVKDKFIKILAHEPAAEPEARANRALPAGNQVVIGKADWSDFDPVVGATVSAAGDGYEFQVTEAILEEMTTKGFVIKSEKPLVITGVEMNNWATPVPATDITIAPAEGDIAAALATATEGVARVGKITINLTAGAAYTMSAPIVTAESVTINGNGATIDASALEGNMIEFAAKAAENTEWTNADVAITAVTVKGLKKALFYSAGKYYYGNFTLINSFIEQAADATTFDYTKGSVALNFKIEGSTIYAPTATTKSLYSSQGGQKATEYKADATQNFLFSLNTMYNLAKEKNFFTHRQNSQKWLSYTVQNNIFVNCGKSGQVIKGLNGGGSSANPTWVVNGNAFNFDGADTSANEETGDTDHTQDETPGLNETVQNSVAGIVAFANAAEGDFTLGFDCAQYAAKIGDPRWLKENIGEAIVLNPETGADLYAALAAAMQTNPNPASITINLAENGAYTITNSLSASKSIIINGNGATVDASNCKVEEAAAPFIQMAALPAFGLNAKGAYEVDEVSFNNVKITGLKAQLIYGNKQKYLIKKLAVDNSVIAIDGTAKKTIFDFANGGNASEIIVNNSTLWANPSNEQNGGLHSSQSGHGSIQDLGSDKQLFAITNSTIYNIANGKTTCSQRRNNTAGMEFKVENSIIVNSGKSGQFIVGLNGGAANSAQTYTINNNSFNFEVEGALTDVSAAEQTKVQEKIADKVLNSVEGVVEFANAAEGDFTLAAACAQNKAMIGDPRWLVAAPIEKLYLIGDINNWKLNEMVEMTFNEETQAFEYEYAPTGQVNFSVADQMFADGDWDGFKAGHRFALGDGNIVPTLGEEVQLVSVFEGNIQLQAGKYKISVTKDLKMTITNAPADGISEVKANQNSAVIYNLNGVRVDKAQKGLYIVNGKKVVIK